MDSQNDQILKYLEECDNDADFHDSASETSDQEELEVHENTDDSDADPDYSPNQDMPQSRSRIKFPVSQQEFSDSEEEEEILGENVQLEEKEEITIENAHLENPSTSTDEQGKLGAKRKTSNRSTDDVRRPAKKKKQAKAPNTLFTRSENNPYILECTLDVLKGQGKKTTQTWFTKPTVPSNRPTRQAARNIVHIQRGSKGAAVNVIKPKELFSLYFTASLKSKIIEFTNMNIWKKQPNYQEQTSTISELTENEFDAFLGLLILSATQKDNHLNIRELFDSEYSGNRYKSAMSCERFNFILECLRFDNPETREERKKEDPFTAIREIWELFVASCKDLYKPGSYLTIDEQLVAFRGRCPFRMYMPKKPNKYGIKIVMICDTQTQYMVDAIPYIGKATYRGPLPLAQYFVMELTKTVRGTNRNVTCDNWFTSIPLANELLKPEHKLTIIGTLRKDKPELPKEIVHFKKREVGTSVFCFDGAKTLVSYQTKASKSVVLLSTCHESPVIDKNSKKPEIIESYNSTKGAVDALDQMCSNTTCSRKTRRWPLCIFFNIINITMVNSYVLYAHNCVKAKTKPLNRRQFLKEIHNDMIKSHLQRRLQMTNLPRELRKSIASILKVEVPCQEQRPPQPQGRKICAFCPSRLRRMTKYFCSRCCKAMCGEHQATICCECQVD